MADYQIRITTFCKCGRLIVTIATEYKVYNQDNTLHTCGGIMVDTKTDLTFKDCSEYICVSYGDESQSRCKITGRLCMADEEGLDCSMWEEEKTEILKEDRHE